MREYKIKRGYRADVEGLVTKYFGTKGDLSKGFTFTTRGIGDIYMKRDDNSLFVEIKPSKERCAEYSIIKNWNDFLFEATGKDAKERKKEFNQR